MKPTICVTIGICTKNCEMTIKDCIKSVISQDYPPKYIDLVIVDGGSKDRTLSIIEEELSRISLRYKIIHESSGLGYARQSVVENALGEYIIWVDGDMVLPIDFVSKQVEFMENKPKAGIGKGKYMMCKEESLVADLENLQFVLDFRHEGKTNSKVLATSGCIYRVKAVRQVGGFDRNIKGVGEDMDIEHRIRNAGWELHITPANFCEIRRKSWKSLWSEYYWHGYGGYYLFKKNRHLIDYYKMFPPIAIAKELKKSVTAYKLFKRKIFLLLPLHYVFKRIAWFSGFVKNYVNIILKHANSRFSSC